MNLKRLGAAALAVFLIASVFAGGAMGAVSYDSETTDTSTTSDITGGETINNFNASSDQYKWVEVSADSNDTKLEVVDNDTDEVIETFTPSHSSFEETNGSDGGYYAWNLTHEELFAHVPVEANSNTTVDLVAYNNTSAENPDTTTATVTLAATNERTVVYAGDTFTSSSTFEELTENRIAGFAMPLDISTFASEANIADIEQDNVAVDGDNTTVTYVLSASNASDPFDEAASNAEDSERLESQLWINGNAHAIYQAGSVPDDVESSDTYGVYDSSADTLEINVGEDYEDESSLDIEMMGNKEYGILTQLTAEFGPLSSVPMIGASAALFLVAGRRRLAA